MRGMDKIAVRPNGCWEWQAFKDWYGYGRITVSRVTWAAHRYFYTELVGPIPEGLHIDHLCRNRACVNPEHLEAVPKTVNDLRGESFAAKNARKTHCLRGHEFTPENTYRWAGGRGRACRTCMRQRSRRGRQKVA